MIKKYFFIIIFSLKTLSLCAKDETVKKYIINEKNYSVRFEAQITMGSFEGQADKISGYVYLDTSRHIIESFYIELNVSDIKTGLSLRDKHMQESYLNMKSFPKIIFSSSSQIKLNNDFSQKKKVKLKGDFFIHGVKKEARIDLDIEKISFLNEKLRKHILSFSVKSNFKLNIFDYQIKQPKYLLMSMFPILDINVELSFTKVE